MSSALTVFALAEHLAPVDGRTLEPETRVRVLEGEHQGRAGVVTDLGAFIEVQLHATDDLPYS